MFTIDLLKGEALPKKSSPKTIAVAVVAIVVPVVAGLVMFSFYLRGSIDISVKKQEIVGYEKEIERLSDAVEEQKSYEKEKGVYGSCLSEVAKSVGKHTQWSPILVTLVENMPDSVILGKLEVRERMVKRKVPRKDDPEKTTVVSVPVKTLQMTVVADQQPNIDEAIRNFRDQLRSSAALASELDDIRVSQGSDTFEGKEAVFYEIDCIFKPEL